MFVYGNAHHINLMQGLQGHAYTRYFGDMAETWTVAK